MTESGSPLQQLYPHLADEKSPAGIADRVLLESARGKAKSSAALKERFFEQHGEQVVAAAHGIASVYESGGRMFSMGNGGSSCDAAHFAVEFTHPVSVGRPSLPAVHLADDTALLTALGNDVGFEHVYARRFEALARAGDGLIAFSTSGNSANLLAALRKARQTGCRTFALLGHDGGEIASSGCVDHCLVVPGDSIHRVQEVHVAIYHVLWDLVHTILADKRGRMAGRSGA